MTKKKSTKGMTFLERWLGLYPGPPPGPPPPDAKALQKQSLERVAQLGKEGKKKEHDGIPVKGRGR